MYLHQSVQGTIQVPVFEPVSLSSPPAAVKTKTGSASSAAAPETIDSSVEAARALSGTTSAEEQHIEAEYLNYPPLPRWMRVGSLKPCYHIDIHDDIPTYGRSTVALALLASQGVAIAWIWNFIANLIALACDSCEGVGHACVISAMFMLFFVPGSFVCWFRPLYSALHRVRAVLCFNCFGLGQLVTSP
eukprot:m.123671 g.123671  ORF g.123671 m.123671 type:complete len:189 (+) comp9332_c0_seq4:147-713(+)